VEVTTEQVKDVLLDMLSEIIDTKHFDMVIRVEDETV
jgi:hypothetical protein